MNVHQPIVKKLCLTNESSTRSFASQLSKSPELANAFIELKGDLGAGKTTLVRHLLQHLGIQGRIKSPTYAIVESYDGVQFLHQKGKVWHFDFYRFNDPQEWEDAGFRDIFAASGLKIVEWPEKAAALLPVADLVLQLEVGTDETRNVILTALTETGQSLIKEVCF